MKIAIKKKDGIRYEYDAHSLQESKEAIAIINEENVYFIFKDEIEDVKVEVKNEGD